MQQPVHDQRGFDGLAEADFVGEQPAHRHPRGRALGDVELVREEPDASAEERAEAAGLAGGEQVQDVEPGQEVLGRRRRRPRQPLEQRPIASAGSVTSGTSASLFAASRSVAPLSGKWTTRTRPSIAVTRPVPSSELKRWVRWSPTDHGLPFEAGTAMQRRRLGRGQGQRHVSGTPAVMLGAATPRRMLDAASCRRARGGHPHRAAAYHLRPWLRVPPLSCSAFVADIKIGYRAFDSV